MPPGCRGAVRPEKRVTARSGGSPEEVDRAALADEAGAELLEDAVGLHEDAPVALDGVRIVGAVRLVLIEADGALYFVGKRVDLHGTAERLHLRHEPR